MEAGFTELAAQLGAQVAAGDPVAAVHSALAASPAPWLLIFDNAGGQGPVQRFLPPAGNGRVLITSQSAAWPRGQAVHVPPLGIEVAAVFLVNRTGDPASQAAAALADELGGLPLALEQAAAYIQATGTTLTAYLSVFRDREADLLARGEAAGHPADVAATLGLALTRLEEEAPPAAGLLRLLACLAPEPAPLNPAARRRADRWHACPRCGGHSRAAASGSGRGRRCGRRAAPLLANHSGRERPGADAPPGPVRHPHRATRGGGCPVAAGRRRPGRGRGPRRPSTTD
jgi:hypothetical protein